MDKSNKHDKRFDESQINGNNIDVSYTTHSILGLFHAYSGPTALQILTKQPGPQNP